MQLKPHISKILGHPLRGQVVAFTGTRTVLNTMHRMIYPFLAVFGRGLGVDLVVLSLAVSFRSLVGAFGPFLALVADRKGRKTGMLLGLIIFIFGAGLVTFRPTYLTFLLTLALTLMGKYVFDPSLQAYIGDRVSYRRRGTVIAATEIGWSLSFILGVPIMGLLIARVGWIAPFPALGLLGFLALGLLVWMLPRDPAPIDRRTLRENLWSILYSPPALAGLSFGLLISTANEVVNLIFGVWLEDSFGLKVAALGAASAVIGLSELSGELMVGGFTDRLGKLRATMLGAMLNSLVAIALPFLGRSLVGALAGLFCFYVTFEFTLVSCIPLMTEILPSARATLMAANVAGLSLGRAFGALLSPQIYGLSQLYPSLPGISASALAAVLFNLLALFMLRNFVRVESEETLTN